MQPRPVTTSRMRVHLCERLARTILAVTTTRRHLCGAWLVVTGELKPYEGVHVPVPQQKHLPGGEPGLGLGIYVDQDFGLLQQRNTRRAFNAG
eukprot:6594421-Pyramimonas_sp.AAC.2